MPGTGQCWLHMQMEDRRLERSLVERDSGALVNDKMNVSQQWDHRSPGVPEALPCSALSGVASPQALCAGLGATT